MFCIENAESTSRDDTSMLIKHYWLFRRKAKKIISSAFMHHRQEMNLSAKFSQATEKKNQCEKVVPEKKP